MPGTPLEAEVLAFPGTILHHPCLIDKARSDDREDFSMKFSSYGIGFYPSSLRYILPFHRAPFPDRAQRTELTAMMEIIREESGP